MKSKSSILLGVIVIALLMGSGVAQEVMTISYPDALVEKLRNNSFQIKLSPLGFVPHTGILHGEIMVANPEPACSDVESVINHDEQEGHDISKYGDDDIFLMADDTGCLESIKAKNIMMSGARIALIKQNINNTLHDKEIDLVHIPVVELEPIIYDTIKQFKNANPHEPIAALIKFGKDIDYRMINMELWVSPTEEKAYNFIQELSSFISNQPQKIIFKPRFVYHSQSKSKNYIGCFSNGKYCAPEIEYEGKKEGAKIVGEGLRQIIINSRGTKSWFKYIEYYTSKCLKSQILWQDKNSQLCSQAAMQSAGIDPTEISNEYNNSFEGNRPQIAQNFYLDEERQAYISEKVQNHPELLINKKSYALKDPESLKLRICTMIHPDPNQQTPQCQKYTKPAFFSTGQILIGVGILITLIIVIMAIYKLVIHRKMKSEMKEEVDKTLNQYYRYMETLEEPDSSAVGKVPLVERVVESNQVGSIELTDIPKKQQQNEEPEDK